MRATALGDLAAEPSVGKNRPATDPPEVDDLVTREYVIDAIPGDGIGIEVTSAALLCIDAVADQHGFGLRWRERDWGATTAVALVE